MRYECATLTGLLGSREGYAVAFPFSVRDGCRASTDLRWSNSVLKQSNRSLLACAANCNAVGAWLASMGSTTPKRALVKGCSGAPRAGASRTSMPQPRTKALLPGSSRAPATQALCAAMLASLACEPLKRPRPPNILLRTQTSPSTTSPQLRASLRLRAQTSGVRALSFVGAPQCQYQYRYMYWYRYSCMCCCCTSTGRLLHVPIPVHVRQVGSPTVHVLVGSTSTCTHTCTGMGR